MKDIVKVGLIGVGNMGKNHLRVLSILKNVHLEFIYDKDNDILDKFNKQYSVRKSKDLKEDLKTVDAVVISTPTSTHYEYFQLVYPYVKNIFIEKPISHDLKTSEKILNISRENNINLHVGFIERFNGTVISLKKLLKETEKVINVDFMRTNKVSSRITDVDVITDLMIHDIDLALLINGDVKDVFSYGTRENGMIAFACAVLTHKNGRFSKLTASRITEKRIRQINATCEDMFIDCCLLRKEVIVNRQTVDQSYRDVFLSSTQETIEVSNQEALLSEQVAFIESIISPEKENISAKAVDGVNAMKIANLIQENI